MEQQSCSGIRPTVFDFIDFLLFLVRHRPIENARVQENAASLNLSDIEHNAAQFPAVDGLVAHLLLRVRGSLVGHRATGRPLHRVRRQVPREVQGPAQRRLPSKYVRRSFFLILPFFSFLIFYFHPFTFLSRCFLPCDFVSIVCLSCVTNHLFLRNRALERRAPFTILDINFFFFFPRALCCSHFLGACHSLRRTNSVTNDSLSLQKKRNGKPRQRDQSR